MIIGFAGPYSADTDAERQANLDAMNAAAARLLEKRHIPLIGINAALPVAIAMQVKDIVPYKAIMDISMAVIGACEGLLMIGESPGANRERDLILSRGFRSTTTLAKCRSSPGKIDCRIHCAIFSL